MSMLAERKRKQKWSLNPRGKAWSEDANKFGQKMLEKMGWQHGKGLGAKENGITEHVKVSYKNDSKGMGYKETNDQWTEHESNFTALLEALTGTKVDIDHEKVNLKSLEKKSESSRRRLHYRKFTRGKDLSGKNEKDLANIFGRKSLKKIVREIEEEAEEHENKPNQIDNGSHLFTNNGSMMDYFKSKLPGFNKIRTAADSDSEGEIRTVGFGFENSPKRKFDNNLSEIFSPRKKVKPNENGVVNPAFDPLNKPVVIQRHNLETIVETSLENADESYLEKSENLLQEEGRNGNCENEVDEHSYEVKQKVKKKKKVEKNKRKKLEAGVENPNFEDFGSNESEESIEEVKEIKKKKKKLNKTGLDNPNFEDFGSNKSEESIEEVKKKKKKLDKTGLDNPNFDNKNLEEQLSKKKKKKSKLSFENLNFEDYANEELNENISFEDVKNGTDNPNFNQIDSSSNNAQSTTIDNSTNIEENIVKKRKKDKKNKISPETTEDDQSIKTKPKKKKEGIENVNFIEIEHESNSIVVEDNPYEVKPKKKKKKRKLLEVDNPTFTLNDSKEENETSSIIIEDSDLMLNVVSTPVPVTPQNCIAPVIISSNSTKRRKSVRFSDITQERIIPNKEQLKLLEENGIDNINFNEINTQIDENVEEITRTIERYQAEIENDINEKKFEEMEELSVGEVGNPNGQNKKLPDGTLLKFKYAQLGKRSPSYFAGSTGPKKSYKHLIKGDIILKFNNTNLHEITGYATKQK